MEETRRDFLSLASHQLRTPLSSTRWVIETLLEGVAGEMTEKQKKYIYHLYQVNAQLLKLASDTLGILRLESGVVPVRKEKFPVAKLFEEVSKTLGAAAGKNGVSFQLVSKHPLTLETDFSLTRNIIESLVANAIDYSEAGKRVLLDSQELPGETTLIVKDEGIGVPKDEQGRIFERFYRTSNAKIMKAGGSGLGLAISQMLAHKIGATITFESTLGRGSTFSLHFPK